MISSLSETIAAIATPPGVGAVALLRISGAEALLVAEKIFRGKVAPSAMKSRYAYLGGIVDGEELIDEVLLTLFRAPRSYTGEDLVEISGHGGVFITNRLLETILRAGARLARPGEFTQRAYLHGKIDLAQAEAVMDLITAQTRYAQHVALEQHAGYLSEEMKKLRAELLTLVSQQEASFDFPEEELDLQESDFLTAPLKSIITQVSGLIKKAQEGHLCRTGMLLALCGAPNTGKSSLLNKLLRSDRAIVSPLAGTTRDTIEEEVLLQGVPFRIIDTAGLRSTEDPLEREGVLRAQAVLERADLLLHLVDATQRPEEITPLGQQEILLFNKIDLLEDRSALKQSFPEALEISCKTGEGIENLIKNILERLLGPKTTLLEPAATPLAMNTRQLACLQRSLESLQRALLLQEEGSSGELVALELHAALEAVGEVCGNVDSEEILGEIFSNFCIGK